MIRQRNLTIAAMFLLLGLGSWAGTVVADEEAAGLYRQGYKEVLDENWSPAITAFSGLIERFPASEWADDAMFWLCYAQEQTAAAEEASFDCYEDLITGRPKSEWADDAKRNMVRLAQALARKGKPEYRDRVRGFGQSDDSEALLAVLVALAEIGDERSLQVIFDRIDTTEDEHLRAEIVEVLADAESRQAVDKLAELVRRDPSLRVRAHALEALAEHDEAPQVIGLLKEIASGSDQPRELRAVAIEELADFESPQLFSFFKGLAMQPDDPELAALAIEALGEIESDQVNAELYSIYAQASSRQLRAVALEAIAEREDSAAIEFLSQVGRDGSDPELAREAISLIGEIEEPEALEALRQLADSELDWRLRATAISAMGELETEAAVRALAAAGRKATDPRLRRAAADALAETELDSAVEILLAMAKSDPDLQVRRQAAEALGDIGSEAAREALIQLLENTPGD